MVSIVIAMWVSIYPNSEDMLQKNLGDKNPQLPGELLHIHTVLPGKVLLHSITSPFAGFQHIWFTILLFQINFFLFDCGDLQGDPSHNDSISHVSCSV